MAYVRSEAEISHAWAAQMGFLNGSVVAFDAGERHEGCRLAAATHLLVGRGQRNHKSICDSLNVQDTRHYRSSVKAEAQGLPLIVCSLTKVAEDDWEIDLRPKGPGAVAQGRDLPFDEWWTETVIDTQGHQFSRRDIVMILRDKNGGAHFDTTIDNPLVEAALRGELSFQYQPKEGEPAQPVEFSLEACMRQIAEELLFSFRSPVSKAEYVAAHPVADAPAPAG